jgi:hypothetical protein
MRPPMCRMGEAGDDGAEKQIEECKTRRIENIHVQPQDLTHDPRQDAGMMRKKGWGQRCNVIFTANGTLPRKRASDQTWHSHSPDRYHLINRTVFWRE